MPPVFSFPFGKALSLVAFAYVSFNIALARAEVAYSAESVGQGAQLYQQFCTECHGRDGRAQMDIISDATDLTEPEAYYSGISRNEIFTSISDGAGVGMPPWSYQITDENERWHLVNFVRSLWTAEQREQH